MRSRPSECHETAAKLRRVSNNRDADKSGVELNNLRSCRRYEIDGARGAMRMQTLHVNDAFVFCSFEFR